MSRMLADRLRLRTAVKEIEDLPVVMEAPCMDWTAWSNLDGAFDFLDGATCSAGCPLFFCK